VGGCRCHRYSRNGSGSGRLATHLYRVSLVVVLVDESRTCFVIARAAVVDNGISRHCHPVVGGCGQEQRGSGLGPRESTIYGIPVGVEK